MTLLKQLLGNDQVKIYANWMGWFTRAPGKHMAIGVQSDDPRTIRAQIRMAKQVGIDGFVVDWYGASPDQGAPTNEATLILMELAEAEGFEISIMLDSGIFKFQATDAPTRNAILKQAMAYVQNTFMASPAYSRIGGLPVVWEFGLHDNGIDMAAFATTFPGLTLLSQNAVAPGWGGSFALVAGFPDSGLQYLMSYLQAHAADATPVVPCLFWQFDDHNPADPAHSIWDKTQPARLIDHHFGDTFTGCVSLVKRTLSQQKNIPAVQLCTWNDYDERTCFEPAFKAITGAVLF